MLSHSSGGWESEVKVPEGWSRRGPPGSQIDGRLLVSSVVFHGRVLISSRDDTRRMGLGPTLITPFILITFFKTLSPNTVTFSGTGALNFNMGILTGAHYWVRNSCSESLGHYPSAIY